MAVLERASASKIQSTHSRQSKNLCIPRNFTAPVGKKPAQGSSPKSAPRPQSARRLAKARPSARACPVRRHFDGRRPTEARAMGPCAESFGRLGLTARAPRAAPSEFVQERTLTSRLDSDLEWPLNGRGLETPLGTCSGCSSDRCKLLCRHKRCNVYKGPRANNNCGVRSCEVLSLESRVLAGNLHGTRKRAHRDRP